MHAAECGVVAQNDLPLLPALENSLGFWGEQRGGGHTQLRGQRASERALGRVGGGRQRTDHGDSGTAQLDHASLSRGEREKGIRPM